jgi:hypothetical protein
MKTVRELLSTLPQDAIDQIAEKVGFETLGILFVGQEFSYEYRKAEMELCEIDFKIGLQRFHIGWDGQYKLILAD